MRQIKRRTVLVVLSVIVFSITNAFFSVGFSVMGKHGVELYYHHRVSKNGFVMLVVPFREIAIWPIGPTVHGGMADGQMIYDIRI